MAWEAGRGKHPQKNGRKPQWMARTAVSRKRKRDSNDRAEKLRAVSIQSGGSAKLCALESV